ncbi:hemagglutinin repeat-containing protein [Stenotrophomonas sp. NPDC047960]|uniref:hemagglutinin repeat-containing protein n=1 Tax=Stenotrophomonas sp. NPDC047960 TaxID=3364531 RepID=UPI0037222B05
MNRVYRLVFNRTLGVMQVASELVTAPRGGCDARAGNTMATLRPVSFALWLALGWVGVVQPLSAQQSPNAGRIIADPNAPADQRPTVVGSANGTPQVNISTPSAAGVSRNQYQQFDVGAQGAILNNSRVDTQTQIGGWVQANPWLATGTARVILNEINGSNPSQLNGYIEVAGARAQVIIANPAGIQVDGAGFLNASRVTLTTGTPIVSNGALEGYRVSGGAIRIAGAGLDASRTDYTDIITRSLQVNAGIWANQLQASLGNNVVSADHSAVTKQAGDRGAPAFALDVGALGGMYANRIWLVGNEQGVGMRNAGKIGAQAGELVVTAEGRLENTGALHAQQDTRITAAGGVANAGTLSAERELRVDTPADIDNRGGTLNARRLELNADALRNRAGSIEQVGAQALQLKGTDVSNQQGRIGTVAGVTPGEGSGGGSTGGTQQPGTGTGTPTPTPTPGQGGSTTSPAPSAPLAAGALNIGRTLDNDGGAIDATGVLQLAASNSLDNSGGTLGVDTLKVQGQALRNAGGTLEVQGATSARVNTLDNSGGRLALAQAAELHAQTLLNRGGTLAHGGTAATAWSIGKLDNSDGSIASNAASFGLGIGTLVNTRGSISHAGSSGLRVRADRLDGVDGAIATAGDLVLQLGTADHRGADLIANQIRLTAASFDNRGGSVLATGKQASTLSVQGTLDNSDGGTLASNGDLHVSAAQLGNANGTVQQAGTGSLRIDAATLQGQGGSVLSNGSLLLQGTTTNLRDATTAAQRIDIRTGDLITAGGSLTSASTDVLRLQVGRTLDNTGGQLGSNGALAIDSTTLVNNGGKLVAAGTDASTLRATGLLQNQGGTVSSNGDLRIDADGLLNTAGSIDHAGTGTLQITATTVNGGQGTLASNGLLQVHAQTLDVNKGSTRGQQVDIRTGSLDNSGGSLLSLGAQDMQLRVSGSLANDGGTISANGAQQIEAGALSNRSGALNSAGTGDTRIAVAGVLDNSKGSLASNASALQLQTGALVNADGAISHAGTGGLSIDTGRLDGQGGRIGTAGTATLNAGAVDHRGASLAATQLDLTAQSLDNRGGSIVATGTWANTLQVADTLDNGDGGTLASNGDLAITAQTLGNAGGTIQQAGTGTLAIDAYTLAGKGGTVLSNGALVLQGDTLDLSNGTTSAQQIQIDSERLTTAGGQLSAMGNGMLQVQARTLLDNSGGTFGSNGALNIAAGSLMNDHGKLIAAGEATTQIRVANMLDNRSGSISGNGSLHIDATLLRNAGGTLVAGDALQLQGEELDLRDGAVGATDITVQAGSLDNSGGTLSATGSNDMLLNVRDRLGNDGGTIAANGAQRIEAGTLSNRDGTLSSAGTANSHITVGGELDNTQGVIASNAAALAVSSGKLVNVDGTLNHAGTQGLTLITGELDGRNGTLVTAGDLRLTAAAVDHRGATLQAAQIALDAQSFDNRGGKLVATGAGANRLTVTGGLDNGDKGLIATNGDLAINAAVFGNAGGTVQQAGTGLLDLTAGVVNGAGGTLVSNGSLLVQGDTIDLRDGTTSAQRIRIDADTLTTAGGALTATSTDALVLHARGQLDNTGGTLAGNGALDLRAGTLRNTGGTVQAAGTAASQLSIEQTLHNRGGKILTTGDLTLAAAAMDNQGGTLHSAADLRVGVDGLLDNSHAGLIASGGDARVAAGTLDNRSGSIEQAGDGQLQIDVQTLQGASGRIVSNGALSLEGEALDISGGTTAARDVHVTAGSLNNAGGTLSATGEQAMVVQVRDTLGNDGGTIAANGAQQITAGALSNVGGTLSSAGSADTRIEVAGQFDNSRGTVASNANALQLQAGSLLNEAGRVAHAGAGGLTVQTGSLSGQQGTIATAGTLTLRAGEVDHRNATLSANQLDIVATGFDNRGGTVVSGGTGPSTVLVQGTLDNGNNGTLAGNGDLQITAATLGNAGGNVQQAGTGTLAIHAHTLNGQGGKLLSNGSLDLVGDTTDLRNGTTAAQRISVQTGALTTAGGTLTAAGTDALVLGVRGTLDNTAGTLATNGSLDLRAAQLFNNQGTVQAAGTAAHQLAISGTLENHGGRILTGGATTVTAARVDNRAGILHTDGSASLTLTVDGLLDNSAQGTINAGGNAGISAQSLNNAAGILAAGAVLQLDSATQLGNAAGLIQAGTDLHLRTSGMDNQSGRVIAGSVDIDTRGLTLDNRAGTLASLTGGNVLRTGLLDNSGGLLQSAGNLSINTAGQALLNANANGNGINSSGTLDITSGAFDNRAGAVFGQGAITLNASSVDNSGGGSLKGAGDLTLRAQTLNNVGGAISVGRNADLALPGALDNRSGLVAAGGALTVQAASVDNRNTLSAPNGPALGLQGEQLRLTSGSLDNQQGQVLADNLTLQLSGQLDNTGGQVSASEVSDISADSIANTGGTLVAGTHQIVRTREITGIGKVLSQGDMTLELRQSHTNTGELAANGTLTLAIQGNLDNQGKLQGAGVNITAGNIHNAATGEISSVGLTRLVTAGELVNRGVLDGRTTHIDAGTLINIGTGRIYGDRIAINAGTLNNVAENVGGVQRSATIAARQRLDLGVGVLTNSGQSLVFSDGDAFIGGGLNGLDAAGTAQRIDNISSTIDIANNLDINALAVNNIRENVVVEQKTTVHAPVTLSQPGWFKNGNNTGSLRNTSNFQPYEVYYLNPADILEDSAYITPDGQQIRRAVVNMTSTTSAYYYARGGLYAARAERARLDPQEGTMVIYYVLRADNRNNPDQLGGAAEDPFRDLSKSQPGSPALRYESDTLTYSSAYGTCTTTCVQLITYPDYDNPEAMLINMQRHPEDTSGNEERRVATRTTVEDILVSAGADAVITAGGNITIATDALLNEYASIAAGRDYTIRGLNLQTSSVISRSRTLERINTFNNVSYTYNNRSSSWSAAPIKETLGVLGAGITAGGKLTIDVGNLRNENVGSNGPSVRDGTGIANLNTGGPGAGSVGPGAGTVQGPGHAAGQGAGTVSAQGPQAASSTQGESGTAVQGPGHTGGQLADSATAQGPGQVGSAGPGNGSVQDIGAAQASQATATGPTAAQGGSHAGSGANAALDRKQAVAAAGNDPHLVVTTTPNASAPSASLFNVDANRGSFLVETDPKFANYRNWLSSDYLLQRAGYEPAQTQKRLGDGFYEQKLVREQIGELTGRRFLDGYATDEDQYRALLEAGATVAGAWGLRPGVALTAEQMARLTSDIVWLVEQDVTLADGSVARALVPQVYLRVMPGDLDTNGALLAGADVDIKLRGDLVSNGAIAGRQLVSIDAGNIRNIGGGQISGQQVGLKAAGNIDIIGSTVAATDVLALKAGGDITVASTTYEWQDKGDLLTQRTTTLDRVAGLYVTNADGAGVLSVNAGGNVELRAAQLANAGTDGLTAIVAGGDINLTAVTQQSSVALTHDSGNFNKQSQVTHIGTTITGAGDVALRAGNDLNLAAASVSAANALVAQAARDINSIAVLDTQSIDSSAKSRNHSREVSAADAYVLGNQLSGGEGVALQAGRDLTLQATTVASSDVGVVLSAGRDVTLSTAQETHDLVVDGFTRKKKTLSTTATTTHDQSSTSYAVGTTVTGKTVDILAGNNVGISGSTVLADNDLRIAAANNVTIESAQDTFNEAHSFNQKKSGITGGFANGVASVGYSSARSNTESALQSTTQVGSAVGSMNGNVQISAGNQLTLAASDVAAGQDLTLIGKDINLVARQDTVDTQNSQSSKSSGFSMGVTYDPTKAYRSARDSTTDGMADSGSTMGDITRNAEGTAAGVRAATTSVVVSGGSQRASGNQTHSTSDARVAQLSAGGDLTLIANGGSITSQGAQMSAEGDALLLATKDIVFDVAHNTESSTNQSSGKGWGFANNTSGLPFGTNNSRGQGAGQSDTITGTQLSVGGGVRMATTEGDITLTAANIAAERDVTIRAAGNLTVQSGQDTVSNANTADSKAIGTVQISDTEKFAGWHRQQHEDDSGMVSQVASTIGSLSGNVNLGAGGKYTQIASNVVAAQDVDITAAEIELLTADETGYNSQSDKDLKIGVFARIKSPFIDLINNVDAARQSDGRLQAMQGMAAGANAYQAGSAIASAAKGGGASLFSAEAGIGFKSASSSADGSSTVSRGSTIQGGGNVNLTSTSGDIHVVQGNLSAGNTLALDSARDILLEAGQANLQNRSKSSNAGAEVGVGVSVGAQTGVYVYAEASVGSSKSNAESSTWQNTTLTGTNISLKAEGDTTLRGATATAERIDVKTGGTLTIESLQDIAESLSKESQVGGRVQVSFGTAWDVSGYASAGKANGSYKGVGQQSGLFAGDGGYHVDAGHVNLVGGAIASTNAANSELAAETFTFTDLKNEMDYRASSAGVSGGFGCTGKAATDASGKPIAAPSAAGQMKDIGNTIANGEYGAANSTSFNPGIPMSESGHDSSTTYATLTGGNITIGGKKVDAADLGVNTDANAAHQALEALPDLQKMLQEQRAMAQATGTVVDASKRIRADINSSIDEANARKEEAKKLLADPTVRDSLSAEQQAMLMATAVESDREIERLQKVGVLVGAITNGIAASSGSTGQIVAGTLAPAISYQIGQYFKENAARNEMDNGSRGEQGSATHLLAHALLGAAVASAGGDSALIGALAAGGAEAAAPSIAKFLFGKESKDLTAAEQETVSSIASMGGGLVGSFQEGLLSAAVGSNAARNAVDNNWGEVGHYSTMATILYLAGFSEDDAKAVALAAWSPDTDRRNAITVTNVTLGTVTVLPQQYNHLLDGETDPVKVKAAQEYWAGKVGDILVKMKQFENDPAKKADLLKDPETQRALHALGDSFAHVKENGEHFGPEKGHLMASLFGKEPDNPYTNKEAFINYVSALYKAASSTSSQPRRDAEYVDEMARKMTAYESEQHQKDILANSMELLNGGWPTGLVNSSVPECGKWNNCAVRLPSNTVNPVIDGIYGIGRPPSTTPAPVVDWSKLNNLPMR